VSAMMRKRSSFSRKARSGRLRLVMSRATVEMPLSAPALFQSNGWFQRPSPFASRGNEPNDEGRFRKEDSHSHENE
jgi:hypothetical protein